MTSAVTRLATRRGVAGGFSMRWRTTSPGARRRGTALALRRLDGPGGGGEERGQPPARPENATARDGGGAAAGGGETLAHSYGSRGGGVPGARGHLPRAGRIHAARLWPCGGPGIDRVA